LNQDGKRNEVDVVWDASKHVGGRIGFRYGDRIFTHFLDFTTGDEDSVRIREYAPLFGFWVKPASNLRFNFDWERTSSDQTLVRIGARAEARYRVQTNYTPKPWAVLGGSVNLWEASTGDALTDYRGHNRNYGLTATLMPRNRLGFDFAYNYTDYMQNAFICFNDSDTTLSVVKGASSCTANGYNDSANPLLTNGIYTNNTNYGIGSITLTPGRAHHDPTRVQHNQRGWNHTAIQQPATIRTVAVQLSPTASQCRHRHRTQPHSENGLELLRVWREIVRRTDRSALLPREQRNGRSKVGVLSFREKPLRRRLF
jgi:hypothetical protein